jgi:hypothetical protein
MAPNMFSNSEENRKNVGTVYGEMEGVILAFRDHGELCFVNTSRKLRACV